MEKARADLIFAARHWAKTASWAEYISRQHPEEVSIVVTSLDFRRVLMTNGEVMIVGTHIPQTFPDWASAEAARVKLNTGGGWDGIHFCLMEDSAFYRLQEQRMREALVAVNLAAALAEAREDA